MSTKPSFLLAAYAVTIPDVPKNTSSVPIGSVLPVTSLMV
jgi:hypothetical protein